jgi:IclR family transcriptional regulator, mhp operon transcriptional activator
MKTVNALLRGLEVLSAIDSSSAVTLTELHRQTGIPKASLQRILKTLREAGWIERNELESRYVRSAAPGAPDGQLLWRSQVSSLSAPTRSALQRRIPWPLDIAVRDGSSMLILDAHRPSNGLSVNYRVLGFRPHMLVSSLGRCYLAHCPDGERQSILAALARSKRAFDQLAKEPEEVRLLLSDARRMGYATRRQAVTGTDSPENFGALAVPIFSGSNLVACLSCSWLPDVTHESEIANAYLANLGLAAGAIGQRLKAAGIGPPPGRRE